MNTYCDNGYIYFYDTNIKLWTIYQHDENGNQVGITKYESNKENLLNCYRKFKFTPIEDAPFRNRIA